jgi:phage shock protein C
MDTQIHESRLHRSRRERVIFGVCGGLGDYFEVDPALIRFAFVLITLAGGAGVLAYIILAIVMPEEGSEPLAGREGLRRNVQQLRMNTGELAGDERAEPDEPFSGDLADQSVRRRHSNELGALILIALGLFFLMGNLGWMHWFNWNFFWPVILIVLGAALLIQRTNRVH